MANQNNGNNPAANGIGIYNVNAAAAAAAVMNGNANVLPSGAHNADMQSLMQSMETLSGWLQQNREEWAGLQEGLLRMERMGMDGQLGGHQSLGGADGGAGVNGVLGEQPPAEADDRPTTTSLQAALTSTRADLATATHALQTHETLETLFESTLTDAVSQIRHYIHAQNTYILGIHRHYTALLEQSREELVEAQLTHQGWQEGLQRLSGCLREAHRSREEERGPWVRRWRGLKEENRVLRGMVGWEAVEDSEEEAGEGEEGVGKNRRSRVSEGEEGGVREGDGGRGEPGQ
ncbi:hypothetical protein LTR53_013110 [Teratosphaeriaceae sp. CCFEE 6253]|nr:hypothetical protein LTR53_013110 [Teratosphaeriaceae sp. CCFEE 6253]